MKKLVLLIAILSVGFVNAQTGYFGSKNIISLNYIGAPALATTWKTSNFTSLNDYELKSGFKIQSPSNRLTFDHILNDKISIGLGYTFSNVRVRTTNYFFLDSLGGFDSRPISNIHMFNHSASLNIKVARGGCINPVGKYWGAEIVFGRASYRDNPLLPNFDPPGMNSLFINGFIGRTFALTNSLFLSLEGRINVLGFTSNGRYIGSNVWALAEDYATDILLYSFPNTGNQEVYSDNQGQDRNNTRRLSRALFEYNYIAFKVGVHYAF